MKLKILLFPLVLLLPLLIWWAAFIPAKEILHTPKINGANFVSPRESVDPDCMKTLQKINARWVSIVPYAFSRGHQPKVVFDHHRQWWGERTDGASKLISYAKKEGLRVMLKPHVWVQGDGWPGEFQLKSDEAYDQWGVDYKKYIMKYAKIADSLNVELFCIGTEFRKVVVDRPDIWEDLIEDVRKVYHGKITYAANWDNYQNVSFWDKLDLIGIDAYFPICDAQSPSKNQLVTLWEDKKLAIEKFREGVDKPVIFTEYGYQSINQSAGNHWEIVKNTDNINLEAQANAYDAIYEVFWDKPWFAGGFLWKWYPNHTNAGGSSDPNFTPQNKPAELVISRWYKIFNG